MENRGQANRHLLDLCVRSERTGAWVYSGFLTPAEQEDFLRCPESARYDFTFEGGYEAAERKLLVAGSAGAAGYPPDPPVSVIAVKPASQKFAEDLSHRDYLGAILNLGIERSLIGDILVREKQAWFFCLDSAADFLVSSLTRVRNTTVSASLPGTTTPSRSFWATARATTGGASSSHPCASLLKTERLLPLRDSPLKATSWPFSADGLRRLQLRHVMPESLPDWER